MDMGDVYCRWYFTTKVLLKLSSRSEGREAKGFWKLHFISELITHLSKHSTYKSQNAANDFTHILIYFLNSICYCNDTIVINLIPDALA